MYLTAVETAATKSEKKTRYYVSSEYEMQKLRRHADSVLENRIKNKTLIIYNKAIIIMHAGLFLSLLLINWTNLISR